MTRYHVLFLGFVQVFDGLVEAENYAHSLHTSQGYDVAVVAYDYLSESFFSTRTLLEIKPQDDAE